MVSASYMKIIKVAEEEQNLNVAYTVNILEKLIVKRKLIMCMVNSYLQTKLAYCI